MFITTAGGVVASAQIVDGAIVDADVNAAAAIAQSKLGAGLNGNTDLFTIESTTGVSHSVTSLANQRMLVIVMGVTTHVAARTITGLYNGSSRRTLTTGLAGGNVPNPFCLVWHAVESAGTQNITVTDSAGTLSDVTITVIKFKSA